ncbi:MAG: glycosyltransferase [Luteitalea sp.]|nr:glycosyltransferase [Luteitalea sp.]
MNVAIFTDNDFEKVNGVTTTLKAVLRCAPADISVRVYTASHTGIAQPDYLALRSVGVGVPFYRGMQMYVPRFLSYVSNARRDGITLVHLTTPGPVGLAAMYVAGRLGVPMVGSFHTQLAEYTEVLSGSRRLGQLMREYLRWPYGKCERILAPSEATRRLLVRGKLRPEKLRLWPRGVDTMQFSPVARSEELRAAWRVSPTRPAVLYVGRISREKGLDIVPVLERALSRRGHLARFVFVGDGPMRTALQRTCPDAVFTGELPHAEVARAMASADVFLFPSRTDTAGNVVLEAQASGLPVIVSDRGGPRENMRPGETGLMCEGEGPQLMADSVCRLVADTALRQRMGEAARQYALGRTWKRALVPLYETYREVAADSRVAGALPVPAVR